MTRKPPQLFVQVLRVGGVPSLGGFMDANSDSRGIRNVDSNQKIKDMDANSDYRGIRIFDSIINCGEGAWMQTRIPGE